MLQLIFKVMIEIHSTSFKRRNNYNFRNYEYLCAVVGGFKMDDAQVKHLY